MQEEKIKFLKLKLLYSKIILELRKNSRKNTIIGCMIKLLYSIGNNSIFQIFTSIIVPVIISILASTSGYVKYAITIFIFFVVGQIIIMLSASFNKIISTDTKLIKESLNGNTIICASLSENLYAIRKDINSILTDTIKYKEFNNKIISEKCGFQKTSSSVCREIYEIIRDNIGMENH